MQYIPTTYVLVYSICSFFIRCENTRLLSNGNFAEGRSTNNVIYRIRGNIFFSSWRTILQFRSVLWIYICEGRVLGEVNSRKRFILIKQYISTATRPLSMSSCYELRRMLRLHWVYKPKISIVILIFNNFLIYFIFVFCSPNLRHNIWQGFYLKHTQI